MNPLTLALAIARILSEDSIAVRLLMMSIKRAPFGLLYEPKTFLFSQ